MDLTKEELKVVLNILDQVNLPFAQSEKVLLPIIVKLRRTLEQLEQMGS